MNKNIPGLVVIGFLVTFASGAKAQTPTPTLQIDAGKITAKVSPTLYGLMTEEINYSYDGGLYAELIRNRVFRDNSKNPAHWSVVQDAAQDKPDGLIALDKEQPLNDALPVSLRLSSRATETRRVGIANDGYWGIPVRPDTTYRASFYARSDDSFTEPLTVSIESNQGGKVFAEATIPKLTTTWQKYSVTLTTDASAALSTTNRFLISTKTPGTIWFNLVSLFPPTFQNRPNGNRIDLMSLLAGMKPKFLRFPGGNYLEGNTLADRFPWQKTLGGLEQRPGHPSCWGYGASDGMGLLEFLEWCEDLQMEPVLAVHAGYALNGKFAPPGPALEPFVQDALDEIEYVIGDTSTKWGAVRAKNGHPAPFPLTYVEIGNEDNYDKSASYDGRFSQFYDAIHAKYPALQLISTVGAKSPFGKIRPTLTSRRPELFDEHYYRSAEEMMEDAAHYDHYDRQGPKIFVGEWATREGSPTTDLHAALGDAAWMTGMERNSDHVVMSCYAPLFVNVNPGGMQWKSNLIGYDGLHSYGSPSYYTQKMFSQYLGDSVLAITAADIPSQTWQPPSPENGKPPAPRQIPTLFYVATRQTATGTIYLKIVNAIGTAQPVKIDLQGVSSVTPDGKSIVLSSANLTDTNSITEPTRIIPISSNIGGLGNHFTQTLLPYSITIFQIETR